MRSNAGYFRYFRTKDKSIIYYNFDGNEDEQNNANMWDGFEIIVYKTVYCAECHKKLGTVKGLDKEGEE